MATTESALAFVRASLLQRSRDMTVGGISAGIEGASRSRSSSSHGGGPHSPLDGSGSRGSARSGTHPPGPSPPPLARQCARTRDDGASPSPMYRNLREKRLSSPLTTGGSMNSSEEREDRERLRIPISPSSQGASRRVSSRSLASANVSVMYSNRNDPPSHLSRRDTVDTSQKHRSNSNGSRVARGEAVLEQGQSPTWQPEGTPAMARRTTGASLRLADQSWDVASATACAGGGAEGKSALATSMADTKSPGSRHRRPRSSVLGASLLTRSGDALRGSVVFTGSRRATVHDPLQLSPSTSPTAHARRPSSSSSNTVARTGGDVAVYDAGLAEAMVNTARRMSHAERQEKREQEVRPRRASNVGHVHALPPSRSTLSEAAPAGFLTDNEAEPATPAQDAGFVHRLRTSVSSSSAHLSSAPSLRNGSGRPPVIPNGGTGSISTASRPAPVIANTSSTRHSVGRLRSFTDSPSCEDHVRVSQTFAGLTPCTTPPQPPVSSSSLSDRSALSSPAVPSSARQLSHKLLTEAFYGNYMSEAMAKDAYLHFLAQAQGSTGRHKSRATHKKRKSGHRMDASPARASCSSCASAPAAFSPMSYLNTDSPQPQTPCDQDLFLFAQLHRMEQQYRCARANEGEQQQQQQQRNATAGAATSHTCTTERDEKLFWTPVSSAASLRLSPLYPPSVGPPPGPPPPPAPLCSDDAAAAVNPRRYSAAALAASTISDAAAGQTSHDVIQDLLRRSEEVYKAATTR